MNAPLGWLVVSVCVLLVVMDDLGEFVLHLIEKCTTHKAGRTTSEEGL